MIESDLATRIPGPGHVDSIPTDYEEARAGSDARGNIGGDTFPLPVVLLAERFDL